MQPATKTQRLTAVLIDAVIVGVPYVLGTLESLPEPLRLLGVVASLILLVVQTAVVDGSQGLDGDSL